jgi:major membrane immunogen (membrane-anchored lipoprotein)
MKKFAFVLVILAVLVSGCSNSIGLAKRNWGKGRPTVSNVVTTETVIVNDAVPIITIQRPDYQVDIYSFADGGDIHYVSVIISNGNVTASVSDRITKIRNTNDMPKSK